MFGFNPIAAAPIAATDKVNYALSATYTGNAIVIPTLTAYEDETFSAPNVLTGTVRIGDGALTQAHDLSAPTIDTGNVTIADATFAQVHTLTISDITFGAPDVATLTAFEDETFSAPNLNTGTPTVDTTAITQVHAVSGSLAIGAPIVGEGNLTLNHVFASPPEVLAGMDVGQLRFQWMEQYFDAEIWTEQAAASDIWTEQSVSSETWTEAA